MSHGRHNAGHHGGHYDGPSNMNYEGQNMGYGGGPNMGQANMSYGPAPNMGPPNMNYGPGPNMGPPNMNYGPGPNMGPPNMSYGPGPNMGTPNMNYGPGPNMGPPNMNYGPGPNMGQPNMSYGPGPNMGPPNMNYGPGPNMGPSSNMNYNRPSNMRPPNMGYGGGPNMGPPNMNGPPNMGSQNIGYGGPPNANFGAPQRRRKSLLIGINYTGSQHALRGCHQDVQNVERYLVSRGYPTDPKNMVILTDARSGPFYPSGQNILTALDWLVSEPNCTLFLHYSGHGGQVKDPDGDRDSGFDDTIVPVDFERNGQIDSDTLHRRLVSALPPSCTLFVVFDCCHSGSAIELPFVYRTDDEGNIKLMDHLKHGAKLMSSVSRLVRGGFTVDKVSDAKQLFAGTQSFFKNMKRMGERQDEGLGEEHFMEDWRNEHKDVWMYSGCRDDQTSADATIGGSNVGAMSWAFLEVMHKNPNQTYVQVCPSFPLISTNSLFLGSAEHEGPA
jgi:metacaspase-1